MAHLDGSDAFDGFEGGRGRGGGGGDGANRRAGRYSNGGSGGGGNTSTRRGGAGDMDAYNYQSVLWPALQKIANRQLTLTGSSCAQLLKEIDRSGVPPNVVLRNGGFGELLQLMTQALAQTPHAFSVRHLTACLSALGNVYERGNSRMRQGFLQSPAVSRFAEAALSVAVAHLPAADAVDLVVLTSFLAKVPGPHPGAVVAIAKYLFLSESLAPNGMSSVALERRKAFRREQTQAQGQVAAAQTQGSGSAEVALSMDLDPNSHGFISSGSGREEIWARVQSQAFPASDAESARMAQVRRLFDALVADPMAQQLVGGGAGGDGHGGDSGGGSGFKAVLYQTSPRQIAGLLQNLGRCWQSSPSLRQVEGADVLLGEVANTLLRRFMVQRVSDVHGVPVGVDIGTLLSGRSSGEEGGGRGMGGGEPDRRSAPTRFCLDILSQALRGLACLNAGTTLHAAFASASARRAASSSTDIEAESEADEDVGATVRAIVEQTTDIDPVLSRFVRVASAFVQRESSSLLGRQIPPILRAMGPLSAASIHAEDALCAVLTQVSGLLTKMPVDRRTGKVWDRFTCDMKPGEMAGVAGALCELWSVWFSLAGNTAPAIRPSAHAVELLFSVANDLSKASLMSLAPNEKQEAGPLGRDARNLVDILRLAGLCVVQRTRDGRARDAEPALHLLRAVVDALNSPDRSSLLVHAPCLLAPLPSEQLLPLIEILCHTSACINAPVLRSALLALSVRLVEVSAAPRPAKPIDAEAKDTASATPAAVVVVAIPAADAEAILGFFAVAGADASTTRKVRTALVEEQAH
jgi:hypothetical protein